VAPPCVEGPAVYEVSLVTSPLSFIVLRVSNLSSHSSLLVVFRGFLHTPSLLEMYGVTCVRLRPHQLLSMVSPPPFRAGFPLRAFLVCSVPLFVRRACSDWGPPQALLSGGESCLSPGWVPSAWAGLFPTLHFWLMLWRVLGAGPLDSSSGLSAWLGSVVVALRGSVWYGAATCRCGGGLTLLRPAICGVLLLFVVRGAGGWLLQLASACPPSPLFPVRCLRGGSSFALSVVGFCSARFFFVGVSFLCFLFF